MTPACSSLNAWCIEYRHAPGFAERANIVIMNTLLRWLLRAVFVAAALVFALSLAVMMAVLLALWSLRALWLKLTRRAVSPFVMRMGPREGFNQMFKSRFNTTSPDPAPTPARTKPLDVTDVEVKKIRTPSR